MPKGRLRVLNFYFEAEIMTSGLSKKSQEEIWGVFTLKMAEAQAEVRRMRGVETTMIDCGKDRIIVTTLPSEDELQA